jgi:anti-anti-sigma regulatory factor
MIETTNFAPPDRDHPAPSDALTLVRDESDPEFEVFRLSGIIDARAERILHGLPTLVISGKVSFDFGRIKRINSMGIALLLRCFKRIKEEKGADLRVTNLNNVNAMLFQMTGIFQLAKSDDET